MEFYKLNLRLFDNTQTTLLNSEGNDLSPAMRTYYEKQLLKDAKPHLVYDQFGQKRPIPKGSGKTINFRKMDPFGKAGQLVEGVTPSGKKINMAEIEATVAQYGDYVEFSDMLQLTASDPLMVETTEKLADQAGITLDSVTRDVIAGGTNVIYAPAVSGNTVTPITSRASITALSKLRPKDIRVAATMLKRVNAKPIDGSYVAVIHPDVEHDIMEDPEFVDVVKYNHATRIFEGEIGKLAGVRFVVSTQAKIYGPEEIADGLNRLVVDTAIAASTTSVVVEGVLNAQSNVSIPVVINGVANTVTAITPGTTTSTLTIGTAISTAAKGDLVCGRGAGADGSAIYATMVIAKDAYGVTEIEGGGLQFKVKQLGSSGSADPLDQRATTGWKATKTAERLTEAYMVRIEHSAGTFGGIAVAN